MMAKIKLLLLTVLLCTAISASSQETNRLSVSELRMQRGTQSSLTIDMDNVSEIVAVQFTLSLPEGFSIEPSTAIITDRGVDHMLTARNMGNNNYKFAILSATNSTFKGIRGSLVSFKIKADSSLDEDKDYEIVISDAVMSLRSGENVLNAAESGTVHIVSLPDLHVTTLDCSDAVAGSEMTVSWTVKNDGHGSTGNTQWNDFVWLVPDVQGGTSMHGAVLLSTVSNVSALASGESYSNTVNVTLAERTYGNFDVVVSTDMRSITNLDLSEFDNSLPRPFPTDKYIYANTDAQNNKVDEENEAPTRSDNFRYTPIEIKIPPLADLQVPNVVVVVDNSESYEGENRNPSPLNSAGLTSSTAFYSGKKIKVTATVQNKGGAPTTSKTIANTLYISHNADREMGLGFRLDSNNAEISLNPDETTEITFTTYIPYEWYGETYFHVQVDVNDVVYEGANTPNNWGKSRAVDVLLTPGADFKPVSVKTPSEVSHNSTFDITYSVKNVGPGVPFTPYWTDKLYISPSPDGINDSAILIGQNSRSGRYVIDTSEMAVASVRAPSNGTTGTPINYRYKYSGDEYTATYNASLPNNLSAGTYYVYVQVDANNDVFEYDGEDNNILCSGKFEVKSTDLSASLISISENNLITGDDVAIAWSVKNVGQSDISNRKITDGIYASAKADGSDAILLASDQNTISLAKGVSKTFRANVTVPKNSALKGQLYVFVKTNIHGDIVETNTANNKSDNLQRTFEYINPEEVENAKVNGTNLTVHSLTVPAEAIPGSNITVEFSIKNTGTEAISRNVNKELFITKNNGFNPSEAIALVVDGELPSTEAMQADENKSCSVNVSIPDDIIGGQYSLYAFANREKSVSEKTYNDNYQIQSIYLKGNLPDLSISGLKAPEKINTGEATEISWTVTNIGNWVSPSTSILVYLSDDDKIDNKDKLIANTSVSKLSKSATLAQNLSITVEDGNIGNKYIILAIDKENNIEEADETNNIASAQFKSVQSPVADLAISDFEIEGDLKAGQSATVKATVKNVGDVPTRKDKWADAFYLCDDYNFDAKHAVLMGSKSHVGILQPGESYQLSASIKVPTEAQGYYVVYAVADATGSLYETNKDNNKARKSVAIVNLNATPADLSITKLSAPSSLTAGESVTITYTIANNSDNTASGMLRDVIYMSNDNTLDADDEMVGVVSGDVNIEPGNNIIREATGRITNMVEGNYYIIVKTNSTHSIAETDYDNNCKAADIASTLGYARLSVGETANAVISGLFKLPVHDGMSDKTLGLKMNHPEDNPASMYVAFESVPTTARYDRKSNAIDENQQELLVPDVKSGNYYILAQANNANGKSLNEFLLSDQLADIDVPLTISTDEVKFGATSLSIKEGGNGGWISTDVRGALLDSIMDFRLVLDKTVIPAESITFHDQTSTKTVFNLNDAEVGSYDVISELADGTQATLPNGFTVVPGTSVGLGVKIEGPLVTRLNGASPISVTYANGGNTDVSICELLVVVRGGNIAESIEGLKAGKHEIHIIPDTGVDNRGYATISPGTQRTINLFLQQTSGYTHVYLYVVK